MKLKLKLFMLFALTALLVYLIVPSNISFHNRAFADEDKQSTIAGVVVEDMDRSEMKQALTKAMNMWLSKEITITDGSQNLTLNPTVLQFDIDESINTYEMLTKKPWYAFWQSRSTTQLPVNILPSDSIKQEIEQFVNWDTDATYNNVITQVSYLNSHDIEAVVLDSSAYTQERMALAIESLPELAMGISDIVVPLNDVIIPPRETFSLLAAINGQEDSANRAALNFIASMLYSIALHTNSEIIERHSQNAIPAYLEAGIEATIEKNGSKDLRFTNTTTGAIQLKLTVEGNNLKVEAYTSNVVETVNVRVVREREITPKIITRYSNDLQLGQQQLVQEEREGLRVAVYRSKLSSEDELISKDYYAPRNRIVLKSSKQPDPEQPENPSKVTSPIDLDGDGLPDYDQTKDSEVDGAQNGDSLTNAQYDKGGNLISEK